METILVDSPSIKVDDMGLRESDERILDAARRFIAVQEKTSELLGKAEDRHLSGSPGTVYLKRLGHRSLSVSDFENIVDATGSQEDKLALVDFGLAQQELTDRLKTTKAIGLVLEQAEMTRDLYYNRLKKPDLWKPEEVIKLIDVIDRLRV